MLTLSRASISTCSRGIVQLRRSAAGCSSKGRDAVDNAKRIQGFLGWGSSRAPKRRPVEGGHRQALRRNVSRRVVKRISRSKGNDRDGADSGPSQGDP
jgi:hypothetical protein